MDYKIMITPKRGVVKFLGDVKRRFLFFKKLEYCYDPILAKKFLTIGEADQYLRKIVLENPDCKVRVVDDYYLRELAKNCIFSVIARRDKKGYSYYVDNRFPKGKEKSYRPIPHYSRDITDADFFKSIEMLQVTLNRIRRTTDDEVHIHNVFLTTENDYLKECVIVALKNRQTKRLRYLKTYDISGKSSDRLQFVDTMEKAMKVRIIDVNAIYEDIHQKHKIFEVYLWIYDGSNIPASNFKPREFRTLSDFMFKTYGREKK